jgi:SAM-dependent methyltransferase
MDAAVYRAVFELEDRHWWFRGRRAVIRAMLERASLPASPRVLDAGCGTGRNLREYARLGPTRGVDSSPEAIELCRRRGAENVAAAPVEDLPFDDASFELVCATDVLEHLDDDRAALRELRRVTVPGGVLLATVPAYPWLWSDSDVTLGHRRRYTRPELVERIASAGWRPELVTSFNSLLLAPIAIARRLRGGRSGDRDELRRTPAWLNPPLSIPMRLEAGLIEWGLRLPAGVSIGILARGA